MIALPFSAAWEGHTDASRELAQDVIDALAASGLSAKAAAITMGLHHTDLSRQLAGRDPLNLWRLTALSSDFWMALLAKRATRIGGAFVTADHLTLIKGAAALGPRMVRTLLTPQHERRQA